MKRNIFINRTIFAATLMFGLLVLPGLSQSEDLVKGTMVISEVQRQDLEPIAAGSVRDTLKACLGRIPSDATVGQLLLAEQSCEQIDFERNRANLSF